MSVGGGRERPRGRHYAVKMAICTHPLRSLRKFESTGLPGADHSRPCQALPRLGQAEAVDERIEGVSSEIEVFARQDVGCERLMSVPGVGPIISSAIVAAIGSGDAFAKGRDFAARLGPTPQADLAARCYDGHLGTRSQNSLGRRTFSKIFAVGY